MNITGHRTVKQRQEKSKETDLALNFTALFFTNCGRSQWPREPAAARLLRVRIPPGAWMSVSFTCCVLSGRGPFDGMIPRPEEFYRVWCVCDQGQQSSSTATMSRYEGWNFNSGSYLFTTVTK